MTKAARSIDDPDTARVNYGSAVEELYPIRVGRYLLHQPIARGGMATVHAARLMAVEGVTRLVAAKRLHPHYVDDPEFVVMFHDEARIASRIHHTNVVPVLDVILDGEEVILVQEYVHGVPLSYLFKLALASQEPIPLPIVLTVMCGVLAGLHAAHEATGDFGEPLEIVHRDVSPQNVLVSVDGVPRLVDFGIAKASTSMHHTREGFLKGKLAYMSPEQIRAERVTRTADIYAAGVLLWELLVNRRFYDGKNDADFVRSVALGLTPTPTEALEAERGAIAADRWAQVYLLEPIIMRAMATQQEARYGTAADMAAALAEVASNAPATEVAAWVKLAGAEYIEKRHRILAANEESSRAHRTSESARLFDAEVRSSGARVRLNAVTMDANPRRSPVPSAARREFSLTTPTALASRLDRITFDARTLLPWGVVAALLIVIALLTGMVIVQPPTRASATTVVRAERDELPPPPAPSIAQSVATVVPEPPAPPSVQAAAVQPPPPSATAPPPARHGRVVSPVRAAPPRVAPTPARDCNPPFYFEGSRKAIKPHCL